MRPARGAGPLGLWTPWPDLCSQASPGLLPDGVLGAATDPSSPRSLVDKETRGAGSSPTPGVVSLSYRVSVWQLSTWQSAVWMPSPRGHRPGGPLNTAGPAGRRELLRARAPRGWKPHSCYTVRAPAGTTLFPTVNGVAALSPGHPTGLYVGVVCGQWDWRRGTQLWYRLPRPTHPGRRGGQGTIHRSATLALHCRNCPPESSWTTAPSPIP